MKNNHFNFNIIVAVDADSGIGKDGLLPWHLSADMKYFKDKTTTVSDPKKQNAVIMGRKTWESIPEAFRPLRGRRNIVISKNSQLDIPSGVVRASSLDEALEKAAQEEDLTEEIFVIGGASVYQGAVFRAECKRLYITHITKKFDCDVFFPSIPVQFTKTHQSENLNENDIEFFFAEYERNES